MLTSHGCPLDHAQETVTSSRHRRSPLGAQPQRIVFEEARASRYCGNNGVRLGAGCREHVSPRGRPRFQMHATPARLNPPGTPSHGDGDGRSSQSAQTGGHPFPGIRHQYQHMLYAGAGLNLHTFADFVQRAPCALAPTASAFCGSAPFSMTADDGRLWNDVRGIF
jgi:hypothetical protein